MGRQSTGICTAEGSLRIELSYLLKNGYFQKGIVRCGTLEWTGGASISIVCYLGGNARYMELSYQVSNNGGEKVEYGYKVQLVSVPSNLGKGEILYFLCPQTGKRCRILYSAYSSGIFKSREAFKNRIYYNCQKESKYDYWCTRYWDLKRALDKLEEKPYRKTYKGKPTKTALRRAELKKRLTRYDIRKNNVFNWRCYNFGTNLFGQAKDYQTSILNNGGCLYTKYYLEGRKAFY